MFDQLIKNYLTIHWKLPATSLQLALMAKDVQKLKMESPSIDISCGNGTFSFIALGGQWLLENSGIDQIKMKQRPSVVFDFGSDFEGYSLSQATKLKFYKNIVSHNNNIYPLPFEDNFFKTIYYNAIYWVDDPQKMLDELYRILHPEGEILLHIVTNNYINNYEKLGKYIPQDILDQANRFKNNFFNEKAVVPRSFTYNKWRKLILNSGFKITAENPTVPNDFFTSLVNLEHKLFQDEMNIIFNALPSESLREFKHRFIEKTTKILSHNEKLSSKMTLQKAPHIAIFLKK